MAKNCKKNKVGTLENPTEPGPRITTNGDHDKMDVENDTKKEELPTFVLPRCIVRFLEDSPESSMDEEGEVSPDHKYFNSLLAVETCRLLAFSLDVDHRHNHFRLTADSEKLSKCKDLGESMDDLLEQLTAKLQATRERLKERGEEPIVEKFLTALNASEEESTIFRFAICLGMVPPGYFKQNGVPMNDFVSDYMTGTSSSAHGVASRYAKPEVVSQIFDIPLPRVMQLITPDSIWVKEQLYLVNARLLSAATANLIMKSLLEGPTSLVLQGYEVNYQQYNDLKSSVLQQTLLDHAPFRESDAGRKVLGMNDTSSKPLPEKSEGRTNLLADALKGSAKSNKSNTPKTKGKRDRLFDALAISMQAEQSLKKPRNDEKEPTGNPVDHSVGHCAEEDLHVKKSPDDEFGPYSSDLAYLEDQVRANMLAKRIVQLKFDLDVGDDDVTEERQPGTARMVRVGMQRFSKVGKMDENARFQKEKQLEKFEKKLSQLKIKIETRIRASAAENGKQFRLEQLCEALHLEAFEKSCILLLLQDVIIPSIGDPNYNPSMSLSVGALINSFCSSLEDKMRSRRYFYKQSTMIEEGILTLFNEDFTSDLNNQTVRLDRRLFDFLIGMDTEMSELVDGSHLYKPEISVDDVILPEQTKKRVLDAVLNFDKVKDVIHETGMEEKISYGLGQVLLFYGSSGTGKTMLANAIARKLKSKILLVNFPNFGTNSSGSIIKFLFREARINKALLFFDECESLFMSRDKVGGGQGSVTMLLTELERFDGICILATNRAFDLDEAMHRRISLSIEFQKPDHMMREKLWKAIMPSGLPVNKNIDFGLLGRKYELVGGTVKNAWIQSVGIMIQRGAETISQEDLEQAASEQVRNQLTSEDFDRRVVPTAGIDEMVLNDKVKESLNSIVQYSKAQTVLFGQWGFDKMHRSTSGISVLFHGVPGTGKTMAAEAIGFDLAKPLLVVNVAELVSKWVGETGKNISKIFATAKAKDAIIVFDEAEGLFGSRESSGGGSASRHDNLNVGLLLQYIENFTGICVVITNMMKSIDEAFFRRFRFSLEFKMPNAEEREKIWKVTLPKSCPTAKDVNFAELARRYEMSGGGAKNALLRAATVAALRVNGKNILTMEDLTLACDAEVEKMGSKSGSMGMYT